jgi:hypothetical protein
VLLSSPFEDRSTRLLNRVVLFLAMSAAGSAQSPPAATLDSHYQIGYVANLHIGESYINITNTGARGADLSSGTGAATTGAICVNIYAYAPNGLLLACCSCPVTPNGLVNIGAARDLIWNTLTLSIPTSLTIKLLASEPAAGGCVNSAPAPGPAAPGMAAWGSTVHNGPNGQFHIVQTSFVPATLSSGELARLTAHCTFIVASGSGFGTCRSCRIGGLGGARF